MNHLDEIAADIRLAQQTIPNGDITAEPGKSILAARLRLQHEHAPYLLAVVREVAGLHQPVPDGLGDTSTEYGTVSPACGTCGTHGEYAVPWPCPTARALQALTESKERNHEV